MNKQREIKIRAWDKIAKRFIPCHAGLFVEVLEEGGFKFPIYTKDSDENIILTQYTGLKDKDGNEIYEGDLIQTILKEPYVVRYDDSLGQFFGERKSREERETIKISGIAFNRYKVIGNICEHKK